MSKIISFLILVGIAAVLCWLTGCAQWQAYNAHVAGRSMSYDGKTASYSVTYHR